MSTCTFLKLSAGQFKQLQIYAYVCGCSVYVRTYVLQLCSMLCLIQCNTYECSMLRRTYTYTYISFVCSVGPPTSADVRTSADAPRGNPENGYERVVSHTVAKPDDYYIMPENRGRVVPVQTEESGGSNIYEEVPPDRSNFRRYRPPVAHSSLSDTYATVLHSDSRSPRTSLKPGPNSNVSLSGAGVSSVTQQAPRLVSAGSRSRNEGLVDSEYQPLLSGADHAVGGYTEPLEEQHNTAQADTHPVSLPAAGGMRLKDLAGGESTVDDEVPRLP